MGNNPIVQFLLQPVLILGVLFHFTMGSARDLGNDGVRRMTVNAVYWGLGLEKAIMPDSSVAIIGEYKPLKPGFNYEKLGVKPRKIEYYR